MDLLNPPRLDKKAVKQSFNRGARDYDRCAVLQAEVLNRLLERLDYMRIDPAMVLDLGCGTGQAIRALLKRYRRANVIAMDLAEAMLAQAQRRYPLLARKLLVNADLETLPLAADSVDLVFSSLTLQWSNDLPAAFAEIKRVGRPGGLTLFTTLGVNTLQELRRSWALIDESPRVHQFMDMHDVGDAMMRAGLSQPVVDMEEITLTYTDFGDLMRDIKGIGATNADKGRARGLLTPGKLKQLREAYESVAFEAGHFRATYEVIYGHAWFN